LHFGAGQRFAVGLPVFSDNAQGHQLLFDVVAELDQLLEAQGGGVLGVVFEPGLNRGGGGDGFADLLDRGKQGLVGVLDAGGGGRYHRRAAAVAAAIAGIDHLELAAQFL
jgi:hypothetical protein